MPRIIPPRTPWRLAEAYYAAMFAISWEGLGRASDPPTPTYIFDMTTCFICKKHCFVCFIYCTFLIGFVCAVVVFIWWVLVVFFWFEFCLVCLKCLLLLLNLFLICSSDWKIRTRSIVPALRRGTWSEGCPYWQNKKNINKTNCTCSFDFLRGRRVIDPPTPTQAL